MKQSEEKKTQMSMSMSRKKNPSKIISIKRLFGSQRALASIKITAYRDRSPLALPLIRAYKYQPSATLTASMELWNTCSVDHITPNNATLTLTSTCLLVRSGGAQVCGRGERDRARENERERERNRQRERG